MHKHSRNLYDSFVDYLIWQMGPILLLNPLTSKND